MSSRFHRHEWDFLPENAFHPRPGGGMTLEGSKSSAPAPDPRMYDALDKQVQQGDDLLSFIKSSYADNKDRQATQDQLNDQVIKQNMTLSQQAADRSNDQYDYYTKNGRPVITQALKDSQDWDSAPEIQNVQGEARTDQQASFDSAQQQNNRMLSRMGVNPNSTKFAQLNNQLQMQKAASTAGAVQQAGEQRRLQGEGLRLQAGNLASGMPANSMGFAGQSSQMGGAASGIGQSGINSAMAMQNQVSSGMNNAASIYGGAASTYNNVYGNQISAYSAENQASSSSMSGLGSMAGLAASFMADGGNVGRGTANATGQGGKIAGPGSGISDSVPAVNADNGKHIQLSNGEYIVPADVVRKVGEKHFDGLIQKYHTPAAVQRGNLSRSA